MTTRAIEQPRPLQNMLTNRAVRVSDSKVATYMQAKRKIPPIANFLLLVV